MRLCMRVVTPCFLPISLERVVIIIGIVAQTRTHNVVYEISVILFNEYQFIQAIQLIFHHTSSVHGLNKLYDINFFIKVEIFFLLMQQKLSTASLTFNIPCKCLYVSPFLSEFYIRMPITFVLYHHYKIDWNLKTKNKHFLSSPSKINFFFFFDSLFIFYIFFYFHVIISM